jgi:hypothetical protein
VTALTLVSAMACGQLEELSTGDESATASPAETTETPMPEASPTPDAGEPPPSPTRGLAKFPTPSSDADTMVLGGTLWVDARPFYGEVFAFVGDVQCGRGQSGRLPESGIPVFVVQISSDAQQRGCGVPGAGVRITAGAREMNAQVTWGPGFQQPVELVAGAAFATISGELQFVGEVPPYRVLPYINGVLCGEQLLAPPLRQGQTPTYQVVVDPENLQPGCGRAGVIVELRLHIEGESDTVLHTSPWRTGSAVAPVAAVPAASAPVSTPAAPE